MNNRYAVEKTSRLGSNCDSYGVCMWHWAAGDNIETGRYRYTKAKDFLLYNFIFYDFICGKRSKMFTMPRCHIPELSRKHKKYPDRLDYEYLNYKWGKDESDDDY